MTSPMKRGEALAFIGLDVIQWCVQATGEAFMTPLTFPILDLFANSPFSIADESMQPVISDAEVVAFGIGAGVTFGREILPATTRAFPLGIGNDICVGF